MGLIKQYCFYCLLFLLLLLGLFQAQSARDPESIQYKYFPFDYYKDGCDDLYFKSSAVTVVPFHRIAKALKASGYRLMPTILATNLRRLVPYCGEDLLFFVDRRNRLTIYSGANNNATEAAAITLFVPRDEAMRVEEWISLDSQIVAARVEEGDFDTRSSSPSFYSGPGLKVCDRAKYCNRYYRFDRLIPVENPSNSRVVNGSVYIGGARVTKWNIYNDGHVIVHGTDDFFNHHIGN